MRGKLRFLSSRKVQIFPAFILIYACWSGCSFRNQIPKQASLSQGASFNLCEPSEYKDHVDVLQKVEIRFKDKISNLHLKVEINEKHIALVGLNPFGGKTFLIVYDKFGKINYESQSYYSTPRFHKLLLPDYQLIFWPKKAIDKNLIGENISVFEDQKNGNGFIREIRQNGQPLIRIRYSDVYPWKGAVQSAIPGEL